MYYKSVSAIAGGGKTAVLLNTFSKGLARCSGSNWVFFPDPNWLCAPGANTGCIYCEKAFLKELPYLLVTMYAKQYGLATRTDDEKLIGARIDAVIPELRLAFAFSQKGTDREAKVAEVLHFLCKAKRIQLFVIRQKDPIALAAEIKQAFAKTNLFINSDSQKDVAHLRKRYFAQKNNGN